MLYKKLTYDMQNALREKDNLKLSVLRMLLSAIQRFQIDNNRNEIQDDEVVSIIIRQIKQREDSIEQFKKGGRSDLADKETAELHILETYMPLQLTQDELEEIVRSAINEAGATSRKEMGKVIKIVMSKARNKCRGDAVNQIVARFLS